MYLAAAIVLTLLWSEVSAWEVPKNDSTVYYWAMAAAGTTVQEWSTAGNGVGVEITLQKRGHLLLLRWVQNIEAEPEPQGDHNELEVNRRPDANILDVGILYGRYFRSSVFVLSAAGGVGYINGMRRGNLIHREVIRNATGGTVIEEWEEKPFETIGIPLVLQASVQALTMLGVQLEFYVNANPERSWAGWLIGLQVGHVR